MNAGFTNADRKTHPLCDSCLVRHETKFCGCPWVPLSRTFCEGHIQRHRDASTNGKRPLFHRWEATR